MGKSRAADTTGGQLFTESRDNILLTLRYGGEQALIILFIPSRDKHNKPIGNQSVWADVAATLFAELYRGATAFKAASGIFRTERGEILYDEPILLESYADRGAIENKDNLLRLLDFADRMGHETNQDTVALVVGQSIHFIRIRGPKQRGH